MLSLIEVECPHCGAKGRIMVPPVGAIIIGPCPQCQELVVVFCGQVLPLEKEIMSEGSLEERRDHLMDVLTRFLNDRLTKMLSHDFGSDVSAIDEAGDTRGDVSAGLVSRASNGGNSGPITQGELKRFADVDLKLLDNSAYFKSVFEND